LYITNNRNTTAYREDLFIVDENLDFFGALEFKRDKLYCPVVSSAFHGRLDLKRVGDWLLTRAPPHLVATQQRFLQFVLIE